MNKNSEKVVDLLQKARKKVSRRVKKLEKALRTDINWHNMPGEPYRPKKRRSVRRQLSTPGGPFALYGCFHVPLEATDELRHTCTSLVLFRLLRTTEGAEIYEAAHVGEEEELISVKIMPCTVENLKQTSHELSVMDVTSSPAIIRYDAAHRYGRFLLLEMPWAVSLSDVIDGVVKDLPSTSCGFFREEFIVRMAFELLVALKDIHRSGFVFTALNSKAILIDEEGNFYIDSLWRARFVGEETLHDTEEIEAHMSPEQIACSETARKYFLTNKPGLAKLSEMGYNGNADIWSLGLLVYELIFGKSLLGDCEVEELIEKSIDMDFPPLGECALTGSPYSSALSTFVQRCVSRYSKMRPTAADLLEDPLFAAYKTGTGSSEDLISDMLPIECFERIGSIRPGEMYREMAAGKNTFPSLTTGRTSAKHWRAFDKEKPSHGVKTVKKGHRRFVIRVRDRCVPYGKKGDVKFMQFQVPKEKNVNLTDPKISAKLHELLELDMISAGQFLMLTKALVLVVHPHRNVASGLEELEDVEDGTRTYAVPFENSDSQLVYDPRAVLGCAIIEITE